MVVFVIAIAIAIAIAITIAIASVVSSPDLFYAKVDRLRNRIEECCKKLANSSSKIDAVLEEIESLEQRDPNFKAVINTESEGAGHYIKNLLGDKVGIMQRPKGRTSVREQKVLLAFGSARV